MGEDVKKDWHERFFTVAELKARIGEAYSVGAVPDDYRMFGPEIWDFIKKARAAATKK